MIHTSHSCSSSHRSRRGPQHGRKERVLHTRISEQLSEEIRNFADNLRVPASNLVRNILEEVFIVVEDVSDDIGGLFDDLLEEAEGVRERIRDQAAASPRGPVRRSGRRRRNARRPQRAAEPDADVEAELTRDEAAEDPSVASADASAASKKANPERDRPNAAELFPEILGWQPLVLNRDFECGRCQRNLAAGESAFLGLGEQGLTQIALCGRCAGRR